MLIDESQPFNLSTALWDTIIDCQDFSIQLKFIAKHTTKHLHSRTIVLNHVMV